MRRPRCGARIITIVLVALASAGCETVIDRGPSGQPPAARPQQPVPATADAVPRNEPRSKYGNPDSYVVFGKRYHTMKTAAGYSERGVASWYGKKFHGRKTSSGEIYDMYQMSAAHKGLPLPTYVQVRNLENDRVAVVRVNDRGPFHDNRIIDLSYAAALKLGMTEKGTAFVEVRALDGNGRPAAPVQAAAPASGPAPTPGDGAGVYLQVGAFQDRNNAQRLAERLDSAIGGQVRISAADGSNGTIHRVQVGPLASVEAADLVVAALAHLGISTHHFVSR